MKKIIIKISIILVILLAIILNTNLVKATYQSPLTSSGLTYYGAISAPTNMDSGLRTMTRKILGVIQVAGSLISIGALVTMGIKYMAGSVEEKADYKKELPIYVLGAVMLFAITNILGVVYDWATNSIII